MRANGGAMKKVVLSSILWFVSSGAILAQLSENPFVYDSANDQRQACLGIASRTSSYCDTVVDLNDRQMCAGLAASSQDPCRTMTDRNLQLTCYGMAFAPNFPSNCRDVTDPGLQSFCYSVSSWGASANCSGVTDASDRALCQALTYRDSSYCATITSPNDRQFCIAVSSHDSSSCPAAIGADPFPVPKHNDSTFIVDSAPGLDTGCSAMATIH